MIHLTIFFLCLFFSATFSDRALVFLFFFRVHSRSVIGSSRGDYYAAAKAIQCEYVRGHDALMDCNPDVVIFCTSIMSLDSVLSKFPLQRYVYALCSIYPIFTLYNNR